MQFKSVWRWICPVFLGVCVFAHAEDVPVEIPPKEGWVLYATDNYFSLLEVAIASLHSFSSRPVIAVGLNADIPFSQKIYPRLIKKRIDVDLNTHSPYLCKPLAILEADLDYGVYVDADIIANINCDALFEEARNVGEHPLLPKHPDDAWVHPDSIDYLGLGKRSMHYVHCDVIAYSKKCLPFLREWADLCMNSSWLGVPCYDETLMNLLLWKKGATGQLHTCDPFIHHIDEYLEQSNKALALPPYQNWWMFHGNKDPYRGWSVLEALEEKHQVPDWH
jgi:hypothetical protein